MIIIRDRECGNFIEAVGSIEEGLERVRQYEEQDKKDMIYSEDFYEVVEVNRPEEFKGAKTENRTTVYIYREYDENEPCFEETILVLADKEAALNMWKGNVGKYFEDPFDPESDDLILDYDATMVYDPESGTAKYIFGDSYWIVEPRELL